jgi:hypothetical protein
VIAANRPIAERAVRASRQTRTTIPTFFRQIAITNGAALHTHVEPLLVIGDPITDYRSPITVFVETFTHLLAQSACQNHPFEQWRRPISIFPPFLK